jgi:hypothetical protein
MCSGFGRVWKEEAMAYFKVLSYISAGETGDDHNKPQWG